MCSIKIKCTFEDTLRFQNNVNKWKDSVYLHYINVYIDGFIVVND